MPVMDGYMATQKIREAELKQQLSPVHIGALTAHALDENYQRCLEAGMDNVVIKPVKLETLHNMLSSFNNSKNVTS